MRKPEPWNTNNEKAPGTSAKRDGHQIPSTRAQLRHWKTWIALITITAATLMGWYAIWSLLFIYWVGISIRNKALFFVEPIDMKDSPVTFWSTVCCWLTISILGLLQAAGFF
ncbi:Uncharacterised protein [BD1-7 clade bacterium]|uniref:Uncharacterized protein n=1 Tax=BD1-7 clade bacterium TaxID=2029982 RepID=A0A5S9R0T2_9GAMM|nr:Uncharacterised protein [BD1-7 clade bacterium]